MKIKKIIFVSLTLIAICVSFVSTIFASDVTNSNDITVNYTDCPLDLEFSTILTNNDTVWSYIPDFGDGYFNYGEFCWMDKSINGTRYRVYGLSGTYNGYRDLYIPVDVTLDDIYASKEVLYLTSSDFTSNQLRLYIPYDDLSNGGSFSAYISYKIRYTYNVDNEVLIGYDDISRLVTVEHTTLPIQPIYIRNNPYVGFYFSKLPNIVNTINTLAEEHTDRSYYTNGIVTITDYNMQINDIGHSGVFIRDLNHYSSSDVQEERGLSVHNYLSEQRNINVDFTSWIVTATSAFMDFQLIPGISIGIMLAFCVSIGLFILFLKVFAGG